MKVDEMKRRSFLRNMFLAAPAFSLIPYLDLMAHPLAKKKSITPADLDKQDFVLFETGSITRRLVEQFFAREGVEPDVIMETENVEIIKAMVRNGLGISIIPSQAAASDVKAGQLFRSRIAGHSLVRQTGWLYPKMSRLPRTVSEVIRIFETIRPRLQAATRVK